MSPKIRRILSLALALLLTVSLAAPVSVQAAGASAREIEQQIVQIYQKARAYYGWGSFHGYCGALVNAELYLMGITTTVGGYNGNQVFDAYCDQTMSSGGYRICAYPAGSYTLEEALNLITDNGTRDAYNIVAGFQRTPSAAGRRYGHAVVIHAVIDGTVYFMESYDVRLNGRRYPEGTPVSCSLEQFVDYYAMTTTQFDGVLWFGQKSYADQCRTYPANLTVTSAAGASMRSEPCEARTDSRSTLVKTLPAGEILAVTGLYLNTAGEYWYQVGDSEGYVRASQTQLEELRYDDVALVNPSVPGAHREGQSFSLKGKVTARYNSIYTIRAQVFSTEDQTLPVISATDLVEARSYDLSSGQLSGDLAFRELTVGQYRYDLSAIVGNYYVEAGRLQVAWNTVELWSSEFQVVERTTGYDILDLDPCGGTASSNQSAVTSGEPIGKLPAAQREGYVFLGWYTQAGEGGQRIDENTLSSGDMTLYARWISHEELQEKWLAQGQCWYYHSDGLSSVGCIELEGLLFYFSTVDSLGQNWTVWTVTGQADQVENEEIENVGGNTASE